MNLCGPWQFQVDLNGAGATVYPSPDFDSSSWRTVRLPRAFDHCAPGMSRFLGTCWFRRSFQVPRSFGGRRVVLRFEGVSYNAEVWVNGQPAGRSSDAFLPFELEVSSLLRPGRANLLVVRVDNIRTPAELPPFEGWLGQGGILREVFLVAGSLLRLDSVLLTASLEAGGGTLDLDVTVANDRGEEVPVRVDVEVSGASGGLVGALRSSPVSLPGGQSRQIRLAGSIPGVSPWSPGSPSLYRAVVNLKSGDATVDREERRFGFRRMEVRGTRLHLNGEPVTLAGFNRHEDSPRTGMAVDLVTARRDFEDMKRLGASLVRLCHYPHHSGELDLCDEIGLLVMAELPLNGWGLVDHPNGGFPWDPSHVAPTVENAQRSLGKMVCRDAHHPSIVFWSVCNEPAEAAHPEIVEGIRELIRFGKTLDARGA